MSGHVLRSRAPRGAARALDQVTDASVIAPHLVDAARAPGGWAPALVSPRTERDVADALRTARTVLAIGAQSSLTGGATPRGEVLLDMRGFDVLADQGVDRVEAGAGVTLSRLDEHLARTGSFYPPAPTFAGATIGGTIATNAAGAATFKYGATRRWVDAITVVLASGDVLDIRRGNTRANAEGFFELALRAGTVRVPVPRYPMPRTAKLSAGYFAEPGMDLIDLFIGSEGTLGVVTGATLKVAHPKPATCLIFTTLRDRLSAIALVGTLRDRSLSTWRSGTPGGVNVRAIEHMDGRSLALLREDGAPRRAGIDLDEHAAMALLIAIDLPAETTAARVYDELGGGDGGDAAGPIADVAILLERHDALARAIVAPPGDVDGAAKLLALREAVPIAVNQRVALAQRLIDPRIEKTAGDVVVPFDRLARLFEIYDEELARRGLDAAIWGHISDGNLHPNVLPRSFGDVESGREAMLAFGRAAIRLGGAPLAEHGVGRSTIKQRLLTELYGVDGVAQMRAVKEALDPKGTLAPGVLLGA
ncbi:MAG: FAD-binding oxidoreductase [Vicinamibacterales bacterium]